MRSLLIVVAQPSGQIGGSRRPHRRMFQHPELAASSTPALRTASHRRGGEAVPREHVGSLFGGPFDVSALHRVAARDPEVHELLVAVRHLARPDDALHEPGLVERVRAELAAVSPPTAEWATLAA
jgi:hypothetical protein